MNNVNLIPRHRRLTRARRARIKVWAFAAASYAGVMLLVCLVAPNSIAAPDTRLAERAEQAATRLTDAKDKYKAVLADNTRLQRQLEAATTIGRRANWAILLEALDRVRGGDVVLESVEVTTIKPEPPKIDPAARSASGKDAPKQPPRPAPRAAQSCFIRITGYSGNPGRAFEFARVLEQQGPLDAVTVVSTRNARIGTRDVTGFELTATISEKAGAPATAGVNP